MKAPHSQQTAHYQSLQQKLLPLQCWGVTADWVCALSDWVWLVSMPVVDTAAAQDVQEPQVVVA